MTSITHLRVLLACCILGALIAVPTASAAPSPSSATKPAKIPASGSVIAIVGKTQLDRAESPLVLVDTGTVTGTPYGAGTIELTYTLHPQSGTAETAFTITTATGTVTGAAVSRYAMRTASISFSGIGMITGGTGAFAGAASGVLQFNALHSITGKREVIQFVGSTKSVGTKGQRAKLLQQLLASARG
jgi:hypothetical protein